MISTGITAAGFFYIPHGTSTNNFKTWGAHGVVAVKVKGNKKKLRRTVRHTYERK
jgi:hypothetical protein